MVLVFGHMLGSWDKKICSRQQNRSRLRENNWEGGNRRNDEVQRDKISINFCQNEGGCGWFLGRNTFGVRRDEYGRE